LSFLALVGLAGAPLACGTSPRRFLNDDVPPIDTAQDLGEEMSVDVVSDASEGGREDGGDGGDARTDARTDGRVEVGADGARDVPQESNVTLCRESSECPGTTLYCNGMGCTAAGYCAPRPERIACDGDAGAEERVCGCDGTSYPTLCHLQAAGVRLRTFGACGSTLDGGP
jgi:hypothetical protein